MLYRLLMLLAPAVLLASPARAECEDPVHLLDHAEQALLEGRLDDNADLMERARTALGCGELASPTLVARIFLIEGARLSFTGDAEGAALAFRSAHRLAPELWNSDYGPQVRQDYDAAIAEEPEGTGVLVMEPAPQPQWRTAVNGEVVDFPAEVALGFHLVQVLEEDGPAMFAERTLVLDPGETVAVVTGPLDPSSVARAPSPRPTWLLVGSGAALAVAGGATALYFLQNGAYPEAGNLQTLKGLRSRQQLFSATAIGTGALSVGAFSLYMAW